MGERFSTMRQAFKSNCWLLFGMNFSFADIWYSCIRRYLLAVTFLLLNFKARFHSLWWHYDETLRETVHSFRRYRLKCSKCRAEVELRFAFQSSASFAHFSLNFCPQWMWAAFLDAFFSAFEIVNLPRRSIETAPWAFQTIAQRLRFSPHFKPSKKKWTKLSNKMGISEGPMWRRYRDDVFVDWNEVWERFSFFWDYQKPNLVRCAHNERRLKFLL